jgi:glycosyltransferase involved in cell wall biosynthesis
MRVAWIAPSRQRCGIASYARDYAAALSKHADIVAYDAGDFMEAPRPFAEKIGKCDLAHLQYDPSFFLSGGRDFYPALCRLLPDRKVVTVHEVYQNLPGVFPREDIRGVFPVKKARRFLWDLRHPHWAAFRRHAMRSFFADALLVHARFHLAILSEKGADESKMSVVPIPVRSLSPEAAAPYAGRGDILTLGATGFINPLYDYGFLLSVLEKLEMPWRFVWVGGPRRPEDEAIERGLLAELDRRGMRDRFSITGFVPESERDRIFAKVEIACAFFRDRSSSASLADMVAARACIVATRLALTEEMTAQEPCLLLAERDAPAVAAQITGLRADGERRRSLTHACAAYAARFSYDACARNVAAVYERLLAQ